MNNNLRLKLSLIIVVIFLFITSSAAPMAFGNNVRIIDNESIAESYNFNRHLYPEYYDSYNTEKISSFIEYQNYDVSTNYERSKSKESNLIEMTQLLDGPMDSPWPMYCHDTHHTGRSPYSTIDNLGFKKWEFYHPDSVESGIAIADDGTIYYGCGELYAVYPDGTLKWFYDVSGWIGGSCPAIDENGIIYRNGRDYFEKFLCNLSRWFAQMEI